MSQEFKQLQAFHQLADCQDIDKLPYLVREARIAVRQLQPLRTAAMRKEKQDASEQLAAILNRARDNPTLRHQRAMIVLELLGDAVVTLA